MEVTTGRQYLNSIWFTLNAPIYWGREYYDVEARRRVELKHKLYFKAEIHFHIYEYDIATDMYTGERALSEGYDLLIYPKSNVECMKSIIGRNFGEDCGTAVNSWGNNIGNRRCFEC